LSLDCTYSRGFRKISEKAVRVNHKIGTPNLFNVLEIFDQAGKPENPSIVLQRVFVRARKETLSQDRTPRPNAESSPLMQMLQTGSALKKRVSTSPKGLGDLQ